MATTEFTHFRPRQTSLAARFAESLGALLAAVRRGARNRRSVSQLLDLDDRMLRDIGLKRGDVRSALASRFDEDPSYRLTVLSASHRANRGYENRRDI